MTSKSMYVLFFMNWELWREKAGFDYKIKSIFASFIISMFLGSIMLGFVSIFNIVYEVNWLQFAIVGTFLGTIFDIWLYDIWDSPINFSMVMFKRCSSVVIFTFIVMGTYQWIGIVDLLSYTAEQRLIFVEKMTFFVWILEYLFTLQIPREREI